MAAPPKPVLPPDAGEEVSPEGCADLILNALQQPSTLAPIATVMNKISHSLPPQKFEAMSFALMDNGTGKAIIDLLENPASQSERLVDALLVVSHLLPARPFRTSLLKHPEALQRISKLMDDTDAGVAHVVVQVVSTLTTGMKTEDLERWEAQGGCVEAAVRFLKRRPIVKNQISFAVHAARILHVFVMQNSALGATRIAETNAIDAYVDFVLAIEKEPAALEEKMSDQPVLCHHLLHLAETATGLGLVPQREDWTAFLGRCHQHENTAVREQADAALFAFAMAGSNADAEPVAKPTNQATGGRFCCGPGCMKSETKLGEFSLCARCRDSCYCSRECQKRHWKRGHKKSCVSAKEPTAPPTLAALATAAAEKEAVVPETKQDTQAKDSEK